MKIAGLFETSCGIIMPRNDYYALVSWARCVRQGKLPYTKEEYKIAKTIDYMNAYSADRVSYERAS